MRRLYKSDHKGDEDIALHRTRMELGDRPVAGNFDAVIKGWHYQRPAELAALTDTDGHRPAQQQHLQLLRPNKLGQGPVKSAQGQMPCFACDFQHQTI